MSETNSKYQVIIEGLFDRESIDKDIKRLEQELKKRAIKLPVKLDSSKVAEEMTKINSIIREKNQKGQKQQETQAKNLENQITRWKNTIAGMKAISPVSFNAKEVQSQVKVVEALFESYKGGKATLDDVKTGFSTLNLKMKEAGAQLRLTSKDGMGFANMLSVALKKIMVWTIGMTILYQLRNAIQSMINIVRELDMSLLEMQKVTDLGGESLKQFANSAFRAAEGLGRTGKEVIDAAAQFARAGYTIEESLDLSKSAMIMINVAEGIGSVQESTDILIATLRGFNLEASSSSKIVDILNEVSNTTAINFDELAEGLRRTSGVLSQTGTSMEELSGLLVGGFEPLRNIEKVSSGLIMISQRLRGIGEDGEAIDGLMPKLQDEFESIAGISILDPETGGLRSTYEILSDMAKVFPLLTGKQRQYLSELAAGNRQVSVLTAILNNWENVERAVKSATDSLGSANKENEKYLDSIQGRLNKLQSSWQELAKNTINSEFVKILLDVATALVKIIDQIGFFKIVLLAVSGILIHKLVPDLGASIIALIKLAAAASSSATAMAMFKVALAGAWPAIIIAAIVGIGIGLEKLIVTIKETSKAFLEAKDVLSSNREEIKSIIDEYKRLSEQETFSSEDKIRLIELQTILNKKYDGAKYGIDLYSSAINDNTEAIKKNIEMMTKLSVLEVEDFLRDNKESYDKATKFLSETKTRGLVYARPGYLGFKGTMQEYTDFLAKQIEVGNTIFEIEYKRAMDRKSAAEAIIFEYEGQVDILEVLKNALKDVAVAEKEVIIEEKVLPSLSEAIKEAEDLSSRFYDVAESVKSIIDAYDGAALSLKEISELQDLFPEDYLEALRIEEGQIYLNTEALRGLTIKRAEEAYTAAITAQQVADAEYTKAQATATSIANQIIAFQAKITATEAVIRATGYATEQQLYYLQADQENIKIWSNNQIAALQAVADAKYQAGLAAERVKLSLAVFESFKNGTAWINDNTGALNNNASAAGGLSKADQELIKQKEKEIKALEKEKKALQDRLKEYKKYIDAQKEALKLKKEEADFNKELLKKEEDLAKLRARIAMLALDDSEEALAERLRLEEEAAELEEEIAEDKADRIYELQIEALDRLADAFEEGINKQIEAIDDLIEKIREAIDLIREAGSGGGGGGGGGAGGGGGGGEGVGGGGMDWDGFFKGLKNTFKLSQEEIDTLIRWKNGYLKVGMGLEEIIRHLTETARGWQYWRLQEGVGTGEGDPERPYFHSGGIVESHHSGDFAGNLKSNEVFAKLLKGEYVATQAQMNNFMRNTLPKMTSYKSVSKDLVEGSITMNMPITVEGNLDSSTIPEIKKIANQVVMEINKSIIARGNIRSANQTVS